jgi:hypothetical protein
MALSKVDFNNINVTPAASKKLKFNSSANGFETGDVGGSMALISTTTISSGTSTVSITSGINSTYKEYIFKLIDIHPANDTVNLQINASVDGGSNYNVTKTTVFFLAYHTEDDTATSLAYYTGRDLAQSTSAQQIVTIGNANDDSASGTIHLFDPSNTTFVKHFISRQAAPTGEDTENCKDTFATGYFNTTSAIDAIQFSMSSGNIDAGTIKMYGVS